MIIRNRRNNMSKFEQLKQIFKSTVQTRNLLITEDRFLAEVEKARLLYEPEKSLEKVLEEHNLEFVVEYILDKVEKEDKKSFFNECLDDLRSKNVLSRYKPICCAPHSTINFDITGDMNVCCYNRKFSIGKFPDITIKDAWFGKERQKLIKALDEEMDFTHGCGLCYKGIITKNTNVMINKFEVFRNFIDSKMPSNMEFEFGTVCNYECIMCGGKWSSSIRKNREKLPPIITPYNESFIDQLEMFIPFLKNTNFLGGETFLTPLYYKIWDLIALKNKNLPVFVTTNGSIYNKRVQEIFDKLPNMRLVISADSLKKEPYELIRKNSNYENFIKNIKIFLEQRKMASIAFCPMIQNIYEVHEIIEFCIKNGLYLYFNTVTDALGKKVVGIHENGHQKGIWNGIGLEQVSYNNKDLIPEFCLKALPDDELLKVISYLNKINIYPEPFKTKIIGIINMLESYLKQPYEERLMPRKYAFD